MNGSRLVTRQIGCGYRKYLLVRITVCMLFPLLLAACKPEGEIEGTIRYTDYYDGCDYPAGSTIIHRVQLLNGGVEKNVTTTTSDHNGNFTFHHVEDGAWLLRATLKKEDVLYEAVSETLFVDDGKTARCTLTLKKSSFTY